MAKGVAVPAVAFSSPARNGNRLPAETATDLIRQLAWWAFGVSSEAVQPLVEWAEHGQAITPSGDAWKSYQLDYRIRCVQRLGIRAPLHPAVAVELLAPGAASDRHDRYRRLLRLPGPDAPKDAMIRQTTRRVIRVLAAVGEIPLPDVTAAVARANTWRNSAPPSELLILECLLLAGGHHDPYTKACAAPPGAQLWTKDAALLNLSTPSRDYTRQEIVDLLVAAGYSPATAKGNTPHEHPLLIAHGPDRYQVHHHRQTGAGLRLSAVSASTVA